MTGIVLDRMEVEEAGANPDKLASAIHDQLKASPGPVPVEAIAMALDIVEIRVEPLSNFEGALVTTLDRNTGQILVNARSRPQRRRFTIAHELGHFLNPRHAPTGPNGFACSRDDLRASPAGGRNGGSDRHRRQEAEANAFAIELLAPRRWLRPYVSGVADLAQVIALSDAFEISREAGVRRYVECHRQALAVVFSHDGRVVYGAPGREFPRLALGKDTKVPDLPMPSEGTFLSDAEEADPAQWLFGSKTVALSVQTLHQQGGWALTLLCAEDAEEDDGIEDTVERLSRFDR
ncbi:ImmA/IrrE family metallo-endopeptidase [Methylobacterium sp. J-076]|uniref:ImmA/IrrE family metallo-endopeptidase n=1 Tax=Methylobacterium sp. J-076 TaxID=2836655 RepID=UPI001FBAFB7F|nr:ImmA/IrrE family metallo-endopeptidase [Methylobacterium sp. J-076]MCJ2011941.1 ImmA/IrrE family metallo-endopeptidase [Methylobacterium sp. J-076]